MYLLHWFQVYNDWLLSDGNLNDITVTIFSADLAQSSKKRPYLEKALQVKKYELINWMWNWLNFLPGESFAGGKCRLIGIMKFKYSCFENKALQLRIQV